MQKAKIFAISYIAVAALALSALAWNTPTSEELEKCKKKKTTSECKQCCTDACIAANPNDASGALQCATDCDSVYCGATG